MSLEQSEYFVAKKFNKLSEVLQRKSTKRVKVETTEMADINYS
jgi:hypothetical protein